MLASYDEIGAALASGAVKFQAAVKLF